MHTVHIIAVMLRLFKYGIMRDLTDNQQQSSTNLYKYLAGAGVILAIAGLVAFGGSESKKNKNKDDKDNDEFLTYSERERKRDKETKTTLNAAKEAREAKADAISYTFSSSVSDSFIKHYVSMFNTHKQEWKTAPQKRDAMLTIAKTSCAVFKEGRSARLRNDDVGAACRVRDALAKYMCRFILLTRLADPDGEHDISDITDNPYKILLCIDLVMINLVRKAHEDSSQDEYVNTAREYISSAVARMVYTPIDLKDTLKRSVHQKNTFYQKLAFNAHALGVAIDISSAPGNEERVISNVYKLYVYAGHMTVLNVLGYSNYMAKLLLKAKKHEKGIEDYITYIIRLGEQIDAGNVYKYIQDKLDKVANSQPEAQAQILISISEEVVGLVLSHRDLKHERKKMVRVFEEVKSLDTQDLRSFTVALNEDNSAIETNAIVSKALKQVWALEAEIYAQYVSSHGIDTLDTAVKAEVDSMYHISDMLKLGVAQSKDRETFAAFERDIVNKGQLEHAHHKVELSVFRMLDTRLQLRDIYGRFSESDECIHNLVTNMERTMMELVYTTARNIDEHIRQYREQHKEE